MFWSQTDLKLRTILWQTCMLYKREANQSKLKKFLSKVRLSAILMSQW